MRLGDIVYSATHRRPVRIDGHLPRVEHAVALPGADARASAGFADAAHIVARCGKDGDVLQLAAVGNIEVAGGVDGETGRRIEVGRAKGRHAPVAMSMRTTWLPRMA